VEYQIVAPGASPSGMTAGADGNVWFVDTNDQNKVGRVTPSGTITEFALPGSVGGPETITTGPDGNVWLVADSGGTGEQSWIVRVDPKGVVTNFSVPGAGPDGITTGPDGDIWFTEFFKNEIGRMTPAGVLVDEFPIPGAAPRGIVAGPDGNLWFTEANPGGSAIARMSPAGVATDFSLINSSDTNQLDPTAIVAGPDGNLWFTESSGHNIGRITPAGVITEFPLPDIGSPQGLASGPDGNLWFTESGGSITSSVGRITPTGTVRLFPLPSTLSEPIGIGAGRDGRMWFTEAGVNRIGSLGETVPEVGLASRLVSFATATAPATRTVTVTDSGDAAVSIASVRISGSGAASFAIKRDSCGGRTVAIGATCQIDVAVTLGGQGVLAGLLQLTDNATGSPQSVSLVAQLPACRLPVFTQSESPVAVQGGFLDLRTGVMTPDPRGKFAFNSKTGQYSSTVTPKLVGLFAAVYDPIAGRWLPASAAVISPDHSRYAYSGFPQGTLNRAVHVVDLATGRDRVVNLPAGFWNVVGFGQDGIYVNQTYEGIGPGLTLVNPDSGIVRKVIPDDPVFQVGDGAAWVGVFNPKDPLPQPPSEGGTFNEVARRDLATGQSAPWLYVSGASLYVAAESQGRLLVTVYFAHGSQTWIVTGANQAERLTVPATGEDFTFTTGFVSDANGVWIAGPGGIYLWRPGKGLSLVSEVDAKPAGACV
jgi:virginiamycin B lyase